MLKLQINQLGNCRIGLSSPPRKKEGGLGARGA